MPKPWLLLVFSLAAGAATAAPPPPPSPEKEMAFAAASCGDRHTVSRGETVPITIEPVSEVVLGGAGGRVGDLVYAHGSRLTAKDERVSGIVGLTLDKDLGLLAITDRGNWIVLDGGKDGADSVGIAPMQGAAGAPAAIAGPGWAQLVSVPSSNVIQRYDLRDCGLDARAVTIARTDGAVRAMAGVAYSYVLFAGEGGDRVGNYIALDESKPLALDAHEMPRLDGYALTALSGPEAIVPFGLIALWTRDGRTAIQRFDLPDWNDVQPVRGAPPSVLAPVTRALSAVTGYYDPQRRIEVLFVATHAAPGEPTYVFRLETRPAP